MLRNSDSSAAPARSGEQKMPPASSSTAKACREAAEIGRMFTLVPPRNGKRLYDARPVIPTVFRPASIGHPVPMEPERDPAGEMDGRDRLRGEPLRVKNDEIRAVSRGIVDERQQPAAVFFARRRIGRERRFARITAGSEIVLARRAAD